MKKNLIIGVFGGYEWPAIAPWVNSVNRCGFEGDKVLVAANASYATVERIRAHGFDAVTFNRDEENKEFYYTSPMKVHVERFIFIHDFLKERWRDYDYVVTTDVFDVVFQSDPAAWLRASLGGKKLVAPGEGIRYRDEAWNRQNFAETYGARLYEFYKDYEVFNVGTLAGTAEAMKDLALNIFAAGYDRGIPIVDQAVFNFLARTPPYRDLFLHLTQNDDWACQAGVLMDPRKIGEFRPFLTCGLPRFENGAVKTPDGRPYCIVHQYNRVPEWNAHFTAKFAD